MEAILRRKVGGTSGTVGGVVTVSQVPSLEAQIDHIAVAAGCWETARRRWGDELGGGLLSAHARPTYRSGQYRFAGGGKLEIIGRRPRGEGAADGFIGPFLDRYGERIHHITLKVPDVAEAAGRLAAAGLEPVDVDLGGALWKELFLRPSQVGGVVVQVSWMAVSDEEFARRSGYEAQLPAPGAPRFVGATLAHPDLAAARRLWTLLGAGVTGYDEGLRCRWPGAPLELRVTPGAHAGPGDLLFERGGGAGEEIRVPAATPSAGDLRHAFGSRSAPRPPGTRPSA